MLWVFKQCRRNGDAGYWCWHSCGGSTMKIESSHQCLLNFIRANVDWRLLSSSSPWIGSTNICEVRGVWRRIRSERSAYRCVRAAYPERDRAAADDAVCKLITHPLCSGWGFTAAVLITFLALEYPSHAVDVPTSRITRQLCVQVFGFVFNHWPVSVANVCAVAVR